MKISLDFVTNPTGENAMLDEFLSAAGALNELSIDDVLKESGVRAECFEYYRIFSERAQECRDRDETTHANAWVLLRDLTSMMFHPEDRSQPFRPMHEWEDGRTMLPSDLRGEPADSVHEFALRIQDPELRARLMDVVWEANRNHKAAEAAVTAYIASARNLFDPDNWVPCATRYERAIGLATMLRQTDVRTSILAEIEEMVLKIDGQDQLYLTIKLVSLLLMSRAGDAEALAALSDKAANIALDERRFEQARRHLENLMVCCRRLEDAEGERRAKARIAESFETQGVMCTESGQDMAAAHYFEMAYATYRETPRMREKAEEVYAFLRAAQQRAADSMEVLETGPIDVTEQVEGARAAVSGFDFQQALLRLLTIIRPIDFAVPQQAAAEGLEKFVLRRLASGVTVHRDGRTVAHDTPMSIGGSGDDEAELWEQIVRDVSFEIQVRGQAIIQPAMEQMALEHAPTFRDLDEIVGNSPLVPTGHEEIFARGLLAGLRGDMVQALSELVPQFENGLRHLLSTRGVQTSSMDKMHVQDVLMMGGILSQGDLEEILGSADVIKEMKVLFTDDHGIKLRDRLSHGLMSSSDFYTGGTYYAWWLICRLCFAPVLMAQAKATGDLDSLVS